MPSAVKRSVDLVCRYGGEEFAVIMPDTDLQEAVQVAQEIVLAVKKLKIPHAQSQVSEYVTMSLGISSQIPTQELRAKSAIATADICLYEAKKQGRDRFVTSNSKNFSIDYKEVQLQSGSCLDVNIRYPISDCCCRPVNFSWSFLRFLA
jgi:predicted signal transduction protein with EAL and GGDEF domain